MPSYGRTTQGASWIDIEVDVQARVIVLPGGEPIVATYAYLQTTNGSSANVKSVLYNMSDAIVYESNSLTFTDDVGGLKTITWPSTTPAAGTYYLTIGANFISGGANTVNVAYDTVAATANLRRHTTGISAYPTFPNPAVWDAADDTHDFSAYLETSAGSSGVPRFQALRYLLNNN